MLVVLACSGCATQLDVNAGTKADDWQAPARAEYDVRTEEELRIQLEHLIWEYAGQHLQVAGGSGASYGMCIMTSAAAGAAVGGTVGPGCTIVAGAATTTPAAPIAAPIAIVCGVGAATKLDAALGAIIAGAAALFLCDGSVTQLARQALDQVPRITVLESERNTEPMPPTNRPPVMSTETLIATLITAYLTQRDEQRDRECHTSARGVQSTGEGFPPSGTTLSEFGAHSTVGQRLALLNTHWHSGVRAGHYTDTQRDEDVIGAEAHPSQNNIIINQAAATRMSAVRPELDWLLAHEFGHLIHGLSARSTYSRYAREQSSDCLAGYALGYLHCMGQLSNAELAVALGAAASRGDSPDWPNDVHARHGGRSSSQHRRRSNQLHPAKSRSLRAVELLSTPRYRRNPPGTPLRNGQVVASMLGLPFPCGRRRHVLR